MNRELHDTGGQGQSINRATLGGGCFWCLEAILREVSGVSEVTSGYSGGSVLDPTYQEVCSGETGHAEVVQFAFDPSIISFREILYIFFSVHDPTTLNRQGPDVGTQYRSVVFCHDTQQQAVASEVIDELEAAALWESPVMTEVSPLINFFEAERDHQNYFNLNPERPYCQAMISPKVQKFRAVFVRYLKA